MDERFEHLREVVRAEYPGIQDGYIFRTLICDGCGFSVTGLGREAPSSEGWSLGPHGAGEDFCPRCRP